MARKKEKDYLFRGVTVHPETKHGTAHHFAANPIVSWGWHAEPWGDRRSSGTGFTRLADAQADAESALGPVRWLSPRNGRVEGKFGPPDRLERMGPAVVL